MTPRKAATGSSTVSASTLRRPISSSIKSAGRRPRATLSRMSATVPPRVTTSNTTALATKPKLLLLDEIAGGLVDDEALALVATINAIRAEGVSIVWIEHVVHALLRVVDRLIVLNFGALLKEGDPAAVMASREVRDVYLGVDAEIA